MIKVSVGETSIEAETVVEIFELMRRLEPFKPFLIERERSWSPYPRQNRDEWGRPVGETTRDASGRPHTCGASGQRQSADRVIFCRSCSCGAQICSVCEICRCTDQVTEDQL